MNAFASMVLSPPRPGNVLHWCRRWLAVLPGLVLCVPGISQAGIPPVRISAGSVEAARQVLEGVQVRLADRSLDLSVDRLHAGEDQTQLLEKFSLHCDEFEFGDGMLCPGGEWSVEIQDAAVPWRLPIHGVLAGFSFSDTGWDLESNLQIRDVSARLQSSFAGGNTRFTVTWQDVPLPALADLPFVPGEIQWVSAGTTAGQLIASLEPDSEPRLDYRADIEGLGFDSPEGRFAGESLDVHATGSLTAGEGFQGGFTGVASGGAVLLDNFYAEFGERNMHLEVRFQWLGELLQLSRVNVFDNSSLRIEAAAQLDLAAADPVLDYRVNTLELKFPEAYERYMESMASAFTLDGLTVTGDMHWTGAGADHDARAGVLEMGDLSIVDTKRGRFAVTGLEVHLQSGETEDHAEDVSGQALESQFSWRGLLFQRINLGPGEASVQARPGQFLLTRPLELDVLGGVLALEELRVRLPGRKAPADREPEIQLNASLRDLDMAQLTRALDWPSFDGTVSGTIPGVTLDEGVLSVEGVIDFNIFSGDVTLSDLRIERPFGVLPSLAANLEARNLDLQQLTHTFSFGQISGQMSGFVHDLRMLDWAPVAFDAWFGTPVDETGKHEISRQAVNHLTAIGGGSPTAALTGPFMKLFNSFSYKRLGLGCRLSNNICEVRGLDDDDKSVLIMEGAGIPKVMIRAFNRQMDWRSLVGGLSAASRGESIRIGNTN